MRQVLSLLFCFVALQPAWAENILLSIGEHDIDAEIANTPQARERGLMYRQSLCPDCGMLFVFAKAGRPSFWMKNTLLPLSVAFITTDGFILNIEEMQPNTINIHRSRGGNALYALEMNSGWFARNGIRQGDQVQGLIPTLGR